eukprot:XP_001703938.1 Hypothetical protein GL50803_18368 [Giardia lamblia ATCC 50803]
MHSVHVAAPGLLAGAVHLRQLATPVYPFAPLISEHKMHSPPGVTLSALFWNMYWLAVLQAVHTPSLAAVHITLHYHTITHYHLLSHIVQHSLPKSRLPPAHEPPAEEAHEAPDNNNHSNGDPRDGPRGEPAPVGARGHTLITL